MNDVFLLELHDRLSDLGNVLVKNFPLQDGEELWVVIHNGLPVRLANGVALAFGVGTVDEDLTLVKANVEGTDHCVLAKTQLELFSFVYFVSNVVFTLLDEEDFVNFIKLNVDNLSLRENSWLKRLQNVNHEVLILDIIPSVEAVVNPNSNSIILIWVLLGEVKELFEILDEGLEQEITVNLSAHIGW